MEGVILLSCMLLLYASRVCRESVGRKNLRRIERRYRRENRDMAHYMEAKRG